MLTEMAERAARQWEEVYPAVFVDAIHVTFRNGYAANRPFHAAIGPDLAGQEDVLGL